jgi:hypothetical protein
MQSRVLNFVLHNDDICTAAKVLIENVDLIIRVDEENVLAQRNVEKLAEELLAKCGIQPDERLHISHIYTDKFISPGILLIGSWMKYYSYVQLYCDTEEAVVAGLDLLPFLTGPLVVCGNEGEDFNLDKEEILVLPLYLARMKFKLNEYDHPYLVDDSMLALLEGAV